MHGHKFSYPKVVYVTGQHKVIITCKKHGDFSQAPAIHIYGVGCPKCGHEYLGNLSRLTQKEFIRRAKNAYGNKFLYNRTICRGAGKKLIITCRKHGDFKITAQGHLRDGGLGGCPECKKELVGNRFRITRDEFIRNSRAVHGDKYSYDKVIYIGNKLNVVIVCPKHGDFEQIPNNHIRGFGCSSCSESKGEKRVYEYLKERGVVFEAQKRFKDCRNRLPLSFDFVLESLKVLIEYQGEQHYKPMRFRNSGRGFKDVQFRDSIKKKWARKNGWNLICIPYRVKNITTYLDKRLVV